LPKQSFWDKFFCGVTGRNGGGKNHDRNSNMDRLKAECHSGTGTNKTQQKFKENYF